MTSLRERNKAARRQQILDAARRIIVRKGVSELSIRKLAEEAGVAVKTLYNLYGGRAIILQALVDQTMDRMDEALERDAPLEADPLERCRAVVTVTIDQLLENEILSRSLVLAQYQGLEAGPADDGAVTARASQMQAVAIRAAMDQGLLRSTLDPELLGGQIYHGYKMAYLQWAYGRIDGEGFRARALYGLYVALLGVATARTRPRVEKALDDLEARMHRQRRERTQALIEETGT